MFTAAIGILETQAGALMLVDNTGELRFMTSTKGAVGLVEVMQLNYSAGPCIDCLRTGTAVAVKEISESAHWPAFRVAASQQGFRSALATRWRNNCTARWIAGS